MYEMIQQLRNYLRMAWLYRWYGIVLALMASFSGWTLVYTLPDEYQVSAKLYLDSSSMLRPLLRGLAVNSNMLQDSALMLERTLLTRPNLEEIARRADLDLEADTPEEFDSIVGRLGKKIKITKTKRQHIYDIAYVDQKPERAKQIVDEILNTFLESSLGSNRKETAVTQKFLDEQIAEYESRLITAEEKLKEFKQRNIGVMPGSQGGYFDRLQLEHENLKAAQLELEEAVNRHKQLQSSSGKPPAAGGFFGSPFLGPGMGGPSQRSSAELQELETRISTMESQIDELLVTYTEKFPDVVLMRQRIADLEKKKEAELERIANLEPEEPVDIDSGPVTDPYEQQLKLQVADAASVVAALQSRVKEYQSRVEDLERKVDIVPEVEAELARLNRDYEINRKQYAELLKRREQAYLSQEADQTQDDVKIRILDPPRLPFAPAGPNRILFLSVVLAVAIGIGTGLSFLLSQLNPRIIDAEELKEVTGLNVLGAVGMMHNTQHRRQRTTEVAFFSLGLIFLFAAFLVQLALYQAGIPVHEKVASLVGTIV